MKFFRRFRILAKVLWLDYLAGGISQRRAEKNFTPQEQFQALNTLDFVADVITDSTKETFTKTDFLLILDLARTELFDPDVVVAQQIATAHLECSGEQA